MGVLIHALAGNLGGPRWALDQPVRAGLGADVELARGAFSEDPTEPADREAQLPGTGRPAATMKPEACLGYREVGVCDEDREDGALKRIDGQKLGESRHARRDAIPSRLIGRRS